MHKARCLTGDLALTAALFLLPFVVIVERCIADGSLFSMHPLLNAVAMLVCLPSALQVILLRNHEIEQAKRVWLTKLHLLLIASTGVLMSFAGLVVFTAIRVNGDEHLTTPHSWAALVTAIFFLLNMLQGLLLTFESTKANWQWTDETHALTGILIYIGSVVTMLYGLHTSSWGVHNFSPKLQFQLTMLIIAAHVTLLGKALVLQRQAQLTVVKMATQS